MLMLPAAPARRTAVVYHVMPLPPALPIRVIAIQFRQRGPCRNDVLLVQGFCLLMCWVDSEEQVLRAEEAELVEDELVMV